MQPVQGLFLACSASVQRWIHHPLCLQNTPPPLQKTHTTTTTTITKATVTLLALNGRGPAAPSRNAWWRSAFSFELATKSELHASWNHASLV
jgi:hypothetical protein